MRIVIALVWILVLPVAFAQFIEPLPLGDGAIGGPGIQPGEPIEPPAPWPTAAWCTEAANCLSCQYKSGCYWNGIACVLGRVTYSCPTAGGGGGGGGYASWDFSLTSNSYSKTFGSGETGTWTPTLRLQRLRGFGKTTVLRVELVGGPISNAPRAVFSGTGGDTFTQTFDPTKLSIFDIPVEISVLADTSPGTYRFRVVAEGADVTKTLTLTVLVEGPAVTQPAPSARMYCFEYTSCIDCTTYGEGCGWLNGNCVTARAFPGFGVIETPEDCSRTEAPPIQARVIEPFEFSLSIAASEGINVKQGESISYLVSIHVLSGTLEPVGLMIMGLPPDTVVSFSNTNSPLSALFTISTSRTTPVGNYNLAITGETEDLIRVVNFPLTVVEAPKPISQATPQPLPTAAAVAIVCDSTAQAVMNAIGNCSQINPDEYPNVHEACCKEITKETLLDQLDKTLEDGVIDDKEKTGLLYALNAYLS